jgi:hypothetical protein
VNDFHLDGRQISECRISPTASRGFDDQFSRRFQSPVRSDHMSLSSSRDHLTFQRAAVNIDQLSEGIPSTSGIWGDLFERYGSELTQFTGGRRDGIECQSASFPFRFATKRENALPHSGAQNNTTLSEGKYICRIKRRSPLQVRTLSKASNHS